MVLPHGHVEHVEHVDGIRSPLLCLGINNEVSIRQRWRDAVSGVVRHGILRRVKRRVRGEGERPGSWRTMACVPSSDSQPCH